MDFLPKISLFRSARSKTPAKDIFFPYHIINLIRLGDGYTEQLIEQLRACTDKKEQSELKKNLRAVTWSGYFSVRNAQSLVEYSHLVCMDIDGLDENEVIHFQLTLEHDEHVYFCFVSPSGKGLKVIFRTETGPDEHLQAWTAIAFYLNHSFGLVADESGKDICRLCFLSYDPAAYYNENATPISTDYIKTINARASAQPETPVEDPKSKLFVPAGFTAGDQPQAKEAMSSGVSAFDEQYFLKICHDTAAKNFPPAPGTYNGYINDFARYALRYDIDPSTVAQAIAFACGWPEADKEDWAVINSVYAKFSSERGEWKRTYYEKQAERKGYKKAGPSTPSRTDRSSSKAESSDVNDKVKFWTRTEKLDKHGELVVDKKTGEVKEEFKLHYDMGIEFLQNNGFYKIPEGTGYRLIRIDEKLSQVEVCVELRLEEFMMEYLKSSNTNEFRQVRELFRRSLSTYCNPKQFSHLSYANPEMRRDDAKTAFIYFENCYFEITASGATQSTYGDMVGYIWKKQVIKHSYTAEDWRGCDYHRFLLRAITGLQVDDENILSEPDRKKYDAAVTGIGYMLHKYKDPAITKSIIGVDKKTRSNNDEMNGGSGKSLYGKALGKLRNMLLIDGQNFNFDDQFAFQGMSPDIDFINFNDTKPSFQFIRLFGMITEDFTYRGLYKNSVTMPYSESPKIYLSTNNTLRGEGSSIQRRQHLLEFSDYFNNEHTPQREFGRRFFDEWDQKEWSKFYGFFMHCIVEYLQKGLVPFPAENYEMRKLLEWHKGAGVELNDYLNENVYEKLHVQYEFDYKELYHGFLKAAGLESKSIALNTFGPQMKLWAKLRKLGVNDHKNGDRDHRNGKTWVRFTPIKQDDVPDFEIPLPDQDTADQLD